MIACTRPVLHLITTTFAKAGAVCETLRPSSRPSSSLPSSSVGGGVPILERRLSLRSLLGISADSHLFGAVGSVAALAGSAISRCSHLRGLANPAPGGRAAPAQAVHPHSRLLCLSLSGAASLPAVPERPFAAAPGACLPDKPRLCTGTPVVGPVTSESTVHCIRAAGTSHLKP